MLAQTSCFIVIDALSAPNTIKDCRLIILTVRRDQDVPWLADGLFGRITKDPLRSPVPSGDDAVEVLADNGVVGGFHGGGHSLRCIRGQHCLVSRRREFTQIGHHAQVFQVEPAT